jgi:glycosyltransferase involved in cell wall biosynthesis
VIRPVPHRQNPLRAAWGLEGRFVLAYSGNLGRAHEYTIVLDAIGQLDAERKSAIARTAPVTSPPAPEIVWLFIGGGMLYRAFEAEAKRRGLASVQFRPYQPRERLAESLSAADVHLVSLRPELEGLVVPSKYYGIAAAGRAAIFIGDAEGEIGGLLAEEGIGWTVAPNDGAGLATLAQDLAADPSAVSAAGDRARRTFEQRFDSAQALARWAALLDEVRRT